MFTGIIQHLGQFKGYSLGKSRIDIAAPGPAPRLATGDSLAVNGVCLSLIKKEKDTLSFNLAEETLRRTNLGSLRHGDTLNLELPVTLSTLLSGHLVTGHADGTGKVLAISSAGEGKRFILSYPQELGPYLVKKGSVAVNGVSLTIAELSASSFCVEIIPVTLKNTNLGILKKGNLVNVEGDLIGKYVYNWISKERQKR
jgi:riboflavin synthase